jgi:uncharacterized protein YegL
MRFSILGLCLSACFGFAGVLHAQPFLEEGYNERRLALISVYVNELFPHDDPFLGIYDLERGTAVFQEMLVRKDANGDSTKSPLAYVSDALKQWRSQGLEVDSWLILFVLDEADKVIASSGYTLREKQSVLLALLMLGDYLDRFKEPYKIRDLDGEELEQKNDKENQLKQESKIDPFYQEFSKNYKPHTKNTEDKKKGSRNDQYVVAEANFATPFWGQVYYAEVVRGAEAPLREIDLPMSFKGPSASSETGKEMVVRTYGKRQVRLFLPPGVRPLQPLDPRARILRSASGGYELRLSEDLSEVRISLQPEVKELLNFRVLQILTRKVGIADSEWPAKIREDLFDKISPNQKHDPLFVAQAVANHISGKYLYSVGAREEEDPIDALNVGTFQCDMAAFLMVGVLRDVYNIPSRVVAGFPARKKKNEEAIKSYLVMPGEGHAWVEVYHEGLWHLYDPTPIKKDKKDKKDDEDGEKDEYSMRKLENVLKLRQEEESEKQAPKEQEKKQEQDQQDHVKEASDPLDILDILDNKELASMLTLGSLSLLPDAERNFFRDRGIRVLLRLILDPRQSGKVIFDGLSQAKAQILGASNEQVKSIYQEALRIHEKNHQGLEQWVREADNLLSSRRLSDSYQEIYRIHRAILLFAQTLDNSGTIQYPNEVLLTLEKVLKGISLLAHPDSVEIAQVQKFYESLPALLQHLLRQKYNLVSVGSNTPTKEVANLLRSGKMNDYQLLSLLSPLTDFVLDSVPRPEFEEVKTWQRDSKQPIGRDLMPLQRYNELAKSISFHPGRSLEENLRNGDVFVLARRHRVLIPRGHGIEEGERVSVVLYDTSGSMSGELARFQAGLIAAFTARAISDISASGKHRHKVLVVPFDSQPGTPVKITNVQEALAIVDGYQSKFANTGGGTDIQAALIQALALIADAQNRLGEPLAAANIVLMTDGQSDIDVAELARARNAIDRETPVQTMFVSLGQSNDDLMKFSMDSQSSGFEKGFYREYSESSIRDALNKADANPFVNVQPGFIYTDQNPSALPPETYRSMNRAQAQVAAWSQSVENLDYFDSAQAHFNSIQTLRWNSEVHAARPLRSQLQELRRFGYSSIFRHRPNFLEAVADDIFRQFSNIAGIKVEDLDEYELAELRHFLREAAALSGP